MADESVTQLLRDLDAGRPGVQDRLLAMVQAELRRMAESRMRHERPGHTLQATVLIHDAFMELVGSRGSFRDRAHFFGAAAEAMSRELIDHARRKRAAKRGGGWVRKPFDDFDPPVRTQYASEDLELVDQAVRELSQHDWICGCAIRFRFYLGMSVADAADLLNRSVKELQDDLDVGKAYVEHFLSRHRGREDLGVMGSDDGSV